MIRSLEDAFCKVFVILICFDSADASQTIWACVVEPHKALLHGLSSTKTAWATTASSAHSKLN